MSHEKSFYQVFKCFSADKFDYDEDAVLFESENLGNCHNFAYQLWIEREDDNAFVTIIQPYDGSCRGGYGFPDEEEKPSQFEQLEARNAELEKEVELDEQRVADMMTDVNRVGLENDELRQRNAELTAEVERLEEQVQKNSTHSNLVDAWCRENNSQMPWGKLIALTAVLEKMPKEEEDRLLCLDYPDYPQQLATAQLEAKRLREALAAIKESENN